MNEILENRLLQKKYDSEEAAEMSKEICTEIKEKVKGTTLTLIPQHQMFK